MLNEVYSELSSSFEKVIKSLRRDLMKVRTGRANLGLLDGIKVEFYGTMTPLNQVGTLKVSDPRMITVQPWDKAMITPIEKAIGASDLGLNPSNDGAIVRIPIPPLTGERRKELVKVVKNTGENAKIAIRSERRGANDMAKDLKSESEIGEDEMRRALTKIQEMTNEAIKKIDHVLADKEKEILEF